MRQFRFRQFLCVFSAWSVLFVYVYFILRNDNQDPPLPSNRTDPYTLLNSLLILQDSNKRTFLSINNKLSQPLFQPDSFHIQKSPGIDSVDASGIFHETHYATRDLNELSNYLHQKVNNVLDIEDPKDKNGVALNLLAFSEDILKSVLVRVEDINSSLLTFRAIFLENTTFSLRSKLRKLQNPDDCNKAKKIFCNLNKPCGIGCQVHHIVYCLSVSFHLNRTLVVDSKNWRFLPSGWETFFKPLSNCSHRQYDSVPWILSNNDSLVIELPAIDSLAPRPGYLPMAVPGEIVEQLHGCHADPYIWWVGQLASYIMRPNNNLEALYRKAKHQLNFTDTSYIGIHVRRTDKVGTEAQLHNAHEYYHVLRRIYSILLLEYKGNFSNNVYLATDDSSVIKEMRSSYKEFNFIANSRSADSAAVVKRQQKDSVINSLIDLYLLSHSRHLICTLSSHFCRLAYALMQSNSGAVDSSNRITSLDDLYYFGGMQPNFYRVIAEHRGRNLNEMSLKVGDFIQVAGNLWNGYGKGTNLRTNRAGLFPVYKTEHVIRSV